LADRSQSALFVLLTIPACAFATHFVAPHLHPFVQLRRRSNREAKPVARPFNPSGWITLSQVEERDKLAACKDDSDESDGSSDDEEPEDFFEPPEDESSSSQTNPDADTTHATSSNVADQDLPPSAAITPDPVPPGLLFLLF